MSELKVKFIMGPPECNDKNIPYYSEKFLSDISKAMGNEICCVEVEEISKEPLPVYFIASGGAEPEFKAIYEHTKEPYILLTTPGYNSLAASMEIMGFLQEKGLKGEILHGTPESIAHRLSVLKRVAEAKEKLKKTKLGCFGEPGGLIASNIEFERVKELSGIECKMFDLEELVQEILKGGYEETEYTLKFKKMGYDTQEVEQSLNIYGALKRLIIKYQLSGVTVRCFDLLKRLQTTGCLALSLLNAEGIPAACEGDQKSLLSMTVLEALTGEAGFMANPSCMDIEKEEIIFAHCTIPVNMVDSFYLTTHFESKIGVAIAGDLASQTMTIFKCDDKFSRYYSGKAKLIETMHLNDLCRTQMRLKLLDGVEYFLNGPISNHHIIVKGDWKEEIDEFFKSQNRS